MGCSGLTTRKWNDAYSQRWVTQLRYVYEKEHTVSLKTLMANKYQLCLLNILLISYFAYHDCPWAVASSWLTIT